MSSSGEEPSPAPNWLDLPRDVTAHILMKLGAIEILHTAQRVCSQLRTICKDPSMWTTIDMRNLGNLFEIEEDLEAMCRLAVDRSCGGLLDINIQYFGTNQLLDHITRTCTQIKRLRLVCCYSVTGEALIETTGKLPLLEDLELSYCSVSENALEAVGRHCPRLKSLKLNTHGFRHPHIEVDVDAHAIANTMPNLRRLQLFGNKLTNQGLKAILDGCPHLESLDLRQCFNLNLSGKLGKRCAEMIKDLRRPLDSTHDYEFSTELQDDISFDEGYPNGYSDIDMVSDDDSQYDFSGSDYEDYGCYYWSDDDRSFY